MYSMEFLDREFELERLNALMSAGQPALAVLYGRRRIGKTRLVVEWTRKHRGIYAVADRSVAVLQRRRMANVLAAKLPGFADVEYPTWDAFFARLAREAVASGWTGPVVFDELPYLVAESPELPSILQRWIDHEARDAGLVVALAGSSQRMMQGLVLDSSEPLFGRATVVLNLGPLPPRVVSAIAKKGDELDFLTAWGGVPRYWELAAGGGPTREAVDRLVLDPLGPLHDEPDRLLLEEIPPAASLRPVLDAIGAGAHRVSEIGGRLGRNATSLSRPLTRLTAMGLVRRDVPFGEPPRASRRSLYQIADPFTRLWFRVVAPHRGVLAVANRQTRLSLLDRAWPALRGTAWEDLMRSAVPGSSIAGIEWGAAGRWWRGNAAEWDVVARSLDGRKLLLGEARSGAVDVRHEAARLARRAAPPGVSGEEVRALFVPQHDGPSFVEGVHVVGAGVIFGE